MAKKLILTLIIIASLTFTGCDAMLEAIFPELGPQFDENCIDCNSDQNNIIHVMANIDMMIVDNYDTEGQPVIRMLLERWNPGAGQWEEEWQYEFWGMQDWDTFDRTYEWLWPNEEFRVFVYWDKNNDWKIDANEPAYYGTDDMGNAIIHTPGPNDPPMWVDLWIWVGYGDVGYYPGPNSPDYDMWITP